MTRTDARNLAKGLAFVSPWLVGFSVFMAVPIGLSFYYSLCDYPLAKLPLYIGGDNYRRLVHDPLFWLSLRNTAYYAAMALPAGMAVSLGLALLLNAKLWGQGMFRTIIFLPSLIPSVASAMLWLWMFNSKLGLLNHLLALVGIHGPRWIADARWAMPSLALMSLWGVGNTVVIYLAGLQDVPLELIEAAEIDGAGRWRRLWNVTLPMLSPVIFFNLIMALIGTVQMLTVPYIMTQGGPDNATYLYTMYLYDNAFHYVQMGYASAMAWIQLLIVLALTALAFWSSRRWVHYQGN
jgi:multiple sugar transport system permease protein